MALEFFKLWPEVDFEGPSGTATVGYETPLGRKTIQITLCGALARFGGIHQAGHVSVGVFVLVHELMGMANLIEGEGTRETGVDFLVDDADHLLFFGACRSVIPNHF